MVFASIDYSSMPVMATTITALNESRTTATSTVITKVENVEYYPDTKIPIGYKKNITIGFLVKSERGADKASGLLVGGALFFSLEDVS